MPGGGIFLASGIRFPGGGGWTLSTMFLKKQRSIDIKFVRSRQPGIISLMSYSLLWFVKINTELLRGVFTTQRFDTPV